MHLYIEFEIMKVQTLVLKFKNEIEPYEIKLFRGAVIDSLQEKNILFHNHSEEGFRYSYPLIQYKRIGRKAAIVCIGKGTEAIGEFFSSGNYKYNIGERDLVFEIDYVKAYHTEVQCWKEYLYYKVNNWLALNHDNYEIFTAMDSLVEKTQLLEKIMIGNLLSMLKGIDYRMDDEVKMKIADIKGQHLVKFKGVRFMTFDVEIKCNLSLPDFIGIGKNASIGFGTLCRKK